MAKLTFVWPFGYDDFATAATETTWGFHDVAPITLAIQFNAAATPWTQTYWTPAEIAFNGAESGGGPPAITGTAAVTEAVSTTAASGVTSFVGTGAVTQAVSTTAASGVSSFAGAGAVTQAVSVTAASGVSSFTGTGAVTQSVSVTAASGVSSFAGTATVTEAVSTTTASGTVVNPGGPATGTAAVTQTVSTSTASGTVANPAPPVVPSASGQFTRVRRLSPPITGRARIRQPAQSVEAYGTVRQRRVGEAAIVLEAGRVRAFAEVDDWRGAEDDELLLG